MTAVEIVRPLLDVANRGRPQDPISGAPVFSWLAIEIGVRNDARTRRATRPGSNRAQPNELLLRHEGETYATRNPAACFVTA